MHLTIKKNIFCLISILVRQQQLSLPREKRFVAWLDEVKGMPKLFSGRFI
jgi:hypothetical protein